MRDASRITRRRAVRMAAIVPLAAPTMQTLSAAGEQVAFGLIGAGAWGRYLLEHFKRIASGRCVAACDIDETSLRRAVQVSRDRPRAYTDYRRLLERKDIQAVVVATPPQTHFPIVRDALETGKHVFCEPPLASKPPEVASLRRLADSRAGQVVQVGLQHRYSKFYQTAKQMVAKGYLGELTNIQAQWHRNRDWSMDPQKPRAANWRLFREFGGGPVGELAGHQMDVADWMFADTPEFVCGAGGLDWKRDGRDVYDNICLIFQYPGGRRMMYSAINTNKHLPLFGGSRSQRGEMLMGTEGTIEITLGGDDEPALGLWFYEPSPGRVGRREDAKEIAKLAGASVPSAGRSSRGMPILFERDQITGDESFLGRELKWARRWLYTKGVMVPQEERHPIEAQLEGFLQCCRDARQPRASLETGLNNSIAVMLANAALDEGFRMYFSDFDRMSR
jgi:predicted dehydrogenase